MSAPFGDWGGGARGCRGLRVPTLLTPRSPPPSSGSRRPGGMTSTYGRTPMYGSQTPMYGSGSRTPMYGSQTPLHDGEWLGGGPGSMGGGPGIDGGHGTGVRWILGAQKGAWSHLLEGRSGEKRALGTRRAEGEGDMGLRGHTRNCRGPCGALQAAAPHTTARRPRCTMAAARPPRAVPGTPTTPTRLPGGCQRGAGDRDSPTSGGPGPPEGPCHRIPVPKASRVP